MADVNVNAPAEQVLAMAPPTRTNDQILPRIRWVPIDTLRDALQITPVDTNNAFSSPPKPDALIKFVNDLGYPRVVRTLSDVMTNENFQPWRALTTVINLCLTGKTLGFERPRAPVLQILWGIVNQAHIDYTERMWEEFTQSIHTFIEDKKNLAQHTHGKKKATLIVISSVRFTKLIVYYLQSKDKFHPRPGSPLHLPNEEPVLGYLKFSAKGTKQEVFGMPILNDLITDDIQGEQYYNAYLEKVAKHQRYLAGEEVRDPDSPAPKPAKATKTKASKQSKPLAHKTTTKKPKKLGVNIPRMPCLCLNHTMADMNMPANDVPAEQAPAIAPPTRTDDQILPSRKWVPIGKSNYVLDVHKSQRNLIFLIAVAILKNTNFFRAFTTSSTILAIYIQQFWDTMCFNSSTGLYSFQLDEQWFNLHKDILRDALDITPSIDNNPFVAPPSSDTVIEYVNTLGYPCTLRNVSAMSVNALYQPWRAMLKNLATASRGKKKIAHLLIPNVRFTKLIIHHLKNKHNIHPRPGSGLYYSHEEIILNTLKYVGKDGREIFGMPIPDALLIDAIKSAPYYNSYLEHVTEYQRYLNEEHDKADDKSPEPASSQPPKPTPTPTESSKKDQGKKRKLVMESTDAPSPAKRSKAGKVTKKRMPKSSLQLVDEVVDEGVPEKEPAHDDEEANLQRALELSLKEQGERTQGPARPVVIREPDSGRIQPLPEVQGKGKEKVAEEQAAHDLLTLQTPKPKNPADQFIFQRRTPMPTEPSEHADSPSLDAELALTDSETESEEEVPVIKAGDQDEDQAGPNPGE
ncbi:retrovirus-related pol polyprotein from transposon TNT 1-94 [Tanacetum coccineum]